VKKICVNQECLLTHDVVKLPRHWIRHWSRLFANYAGHCEPWNDTKSCSCYNGPLMEDVSACYHIELHTKFVSPVSNGSAASYRQPSAIIVRVCVTQAVGIVPATTEYVLFPSILTLEAKYERFNHIFTMHTYDNVAVPAMLMYQLCCCTMYLTWQPTAWHKESRERGWSVVMVGSCISRWMPM
jgi:hypothetical protein